jgi:hypothetical protein
MGGGQKALLEASMDARRPDVLVQPSAPPTDPKRCTGVEAAIPSAAPTTANYYGSIDGKAKFRRFALQACSSSQYCSIGKGIYFRNCTGGQGDGYIYFGKADGNTCICFGSTYPACSTRRTRRRLLRSRRRGWLVCIAVDYSEIASQPTR